MDLQLYFAVYIYSDLTIINNDLIELFWNIKQRGEGMSETGDLRLGNDLVNPKEVEIEQAVGALQRASRSKLLQVLIYLNKAEEKRSLENLIDSNAVIKT